MKTYFVKSTETENLQIALGRMIEYARFLEQETGRDNMSFVDTIFDEETIDVDEVDQ